MLVHLMGRHVCDAARRAEGSWGGAEKERRTSETAPLPSAATAAHLLATGGECGGREDGNTTKPETHEHGCKWFSPSR